METKKLMTLLQQSGAFRFLVATDPYMLSEKNKVDLAFNKALTSFGLLAIADEYSIYQDKLNVYEKKIIIEIASELIKNGSDQAYVARCLKNLCINL